tara:strand:- start:81 stop:461 length:381 start_codon:yes stop_codon:yes gene_type:complete
LDLTEKIQATIDKYFDAFDRGSADKVLGLFSSTATVEDPVGSKVQTGSEELLKFYSGAMSMQCKITSTGPARIVENEAAFPFHGVVQLPDKILEFDCIDVMTFDMDGKILTMRAFWGPVNTNYVTR